MGKIKKPNGLHPKKRRLDCYAYACNLNKPQDYVGQIAGYEDKAVFSKEEVIERLIADMLEEDVYVREASYEETPSVNVNIKMYKFLKIRMYKSVHFYFQLFPFFSFASINLSFNL